MSATGPVSMPMTSNTSKPKINEIRIATTASATLIALTCGEGLMTNVGRFAFGKLGFGYVISNDTFC
jgi:hypothetical protein